MRNLAAHVALRQFAKFSIVGAISSLVHAGTFLMIINTTGASALWANFGAFALAFCASFAGHFRWTFRVAMLDKDRSMRPALMRFFAIALTGLVVNTAIAYVIVDYLGHSRYLAAGLMLALMPFTTFLLSKYWAFASPLPLGRETKNT